MPTYPIKVELFTPVVDVSQFLSDGPVTITWGGSDEDATVEPTRCAFTLNNGDGRFTPGRTASPYYPKVAIGCYCRVQVQVRGTWQVRFTGTVDEWKLDFGGVGHSTVSVTATDVLKQLARQHVDYPYVQILTRSPPRSYYPLDDETGPARSGLIGDTSAMISYASGDAVLDWSEEEAPPGQPGPVLRFTPNSGSCYLSTTGYMGLFYTLSGPPPIWGRGTAIGCWIKLPAAPTGDMFLFGTDLFYVSLDAGMRVWMRANLETDGALIAGPVISVNQWHLIGIRTQRSHLGPALDYYEREMTVDGVSATTSLPIPTVAPPRPQWLRVGAYGGPVRAIFAAAGLIHTGSGQSGIGSTQRPFPDFVALYDAAYGFSTGDTTTQRINRWLDLAGVTTGRDLSISTIKVDRQPDGGDVLSLISDVVDAEQGAFYQDRAGSLAFRLRSAVYKTLPDLTVARTAITAQPAWSLDDGGLANDITATGPGERTYRATDDASIAAYGRYTATVETIDTNPDAPRALASWRVHFRANPVPQVGSILLDLVDLSAGQVTAALGLVVRSLVRISTAPSIAPAAPIDGYVVGATETITRSKYTIEALVTDAAIFREVGGGWILGDAAYSLLGTTTTLVL
jgi:hypothetical protein